MASMKHSYASALVLSVAVLLSSSGGVVQGQNQNQAECLYDDAGVATLDTVPDGESGNYLRTCKCVCVRVCVFVIVIVIISLRCRETRVNAAVIVRIQLFNMIS